MTFLFNGIEKETVLPMIDIGYRIRHYNISTKADIGFNYKMSEKLSFNTYFSGNMLLLKVHSYFKDSKYYNIGLGIGVGYSI